MRMHLNVASNVCGFLTQARVGQGHSLVQCLHELLNALVVDLGAIVVENEGGVGAEQLVLSDQVERCVTLDNTIFTRCYNII